MPLKTIRIATRQSPLALWQAHYVREQLLRHWPNHQIELVPMLTSGDRFLKDKLVAAGGKGLFVKELEEALLDNRADLAVHSSKDMPAQLPPDLSLAAICKRHNPLDALISTHYSSLDALPKQAVIGTSSLRRQSQLLAYRPDLQIKPLRGNINTRLSKLESGEYDAIILAAAGLERIGMQARITELLSEEQMLPSCGQGAICIECKTEDEATQQLIAGLNDPMTALCVSTERQVNAQLGGNCQVPLAVFASILPSGALFLRAKILSVDGRQSIKASQTGPIEKAAFLAEQCTQSLVAQGAAELINAARQ